MPKVAIIILNWNGLADTIECLKSIMQLDYITFEVLVVDNASSDGSVDAIKLAYPNVNILCNDKNLGYTGGNNIALRYALEKDYEYFWLLNNDTVVDSCSLAEMLTIAENSSNVGLLSPVIYYYDNPEEIQFCGSYVDFMNYNVKHFESIDDYFMSANISEISLWGTALLIKRRVVENIGLLDDNLFAYYEDCDYSCRALRAGFKNIVIPKAKVFHKDSRSTGSRTAPLQVYLRFRNNYLFWKKNISGTDRFFFFCKALGSTVSYVSELNKKNLLESADACLDGFWHGVRGFGGPWDKTVKMPSALSLMLYSASRWKPNLLNDLLQFKLHKILLSLKKKLFKG